VPDRARWRWFAVGGGGACEAATSSCATNTPRCARPLDRALPSRPRPRSGGLLRALRRLARALLRPPASLDFSAPTIVFLEIAPGANWNRIAALLERR
jgi:hypothetical protein